MAENSGRTGNAHKKINNEVNLLNNRRLIPLIPRLYAAERLYILFRDLWGPPPGGRGAPFSQPISFRTRGVC